MERFAPETGNQREMDKNSIIRSRLLSLCSKRSEAKEEIVDQWVPVSCAVCQEKFASVDSLKDHIEVSHGLFGQSQKCRPPVTSKDSESKRVSCGICRRRFRNVFKLKQHVFAIHNLRSTTNELEQGPITKHVLDVHRNSLKRSRTDQEIVDQSPQQSTSSASQEKRSNCKIGEVDNVKVVEDHPKKSRTDEETIVVNHGVNNDNTLTYFVRNNTVTASPDRPSMKNNALPCTFCGKSFSKKSFLVAHLRQGHLNVAGHVTEKNVYNLRSKTSEALTEHRAISTRSQKQTNSKSGTDTSDNSYSMNSQTELERTAEQMYVCGICHIRFLNVVLLKEHLFAFHVHNEKRECEKCCETFEDSTELYNHVVGVHAKLPHLTTAQCKNKNKYRSATNWTHTKPSLSEHQPQMDLPTMTTGETSNCHDQNRPSVVNENHETNMQQETQLPSFDCAVCKVTFSTRFELGTHLLLQQCGQSTDQDQQQNLRLCYYCHDCSRKFDGLQKFQQHVDQVHKPLKTDDGLSDSGELMLSYQSNLHTRSNVGTSPESSVSIHVDQHFPDQSVSVDQMKTDVQVKLEFEDLFDFGT